MATEMHLIIFMVLIFVSVIGVVLLIYFWLRSSYRKKDLKIRELQKEIEELKGKG
ncbi:lipopolysaccharide assembly protein LapA domain-containing protein [Anaerobacillus arseniciselenatis]|uniref:lipopolysaccharide assembly protein LapA domain-containing protein n=1 Tax=Anaerobacillus arseniciselenatis TaxID=85682 RepID=UPI001113C947|nr:lipopolysaccharide assembly protein LapA domain-containing protein [Anaerobacillus arseniciselenatis]